jgi:ligand-binding sensor domain-containing protein
MLDSSSNQKQIPSGKNQPGWLVWLIMIFFAWWLWPAKPVPPAARILPVGWSHYCHGDQIRGLALADDHLWVGGLFGLKRFDWRSCQDTSAGIASAPVNLVRIEALLIDPGGNLWVAHEMGLICLDPQGVWHDHTASMPDPKVMALCWSKQNELWVGTWRGVAVLSPEGVWRHYRVADGLPGERVRAICADSQGGVWIGSFIAPEGGLLHWSGDVKRIYTTDDLLAHANVAALFEDSQNRMWIGTGFFDRGGVTVFSDWQTGDLNSAKIMRQVDGLAGNKGRSFFEDETGIIWIGSELDGLTLIADDGSCQVIEESDGLNGSEIMCMQQDPEGNLWLGQEKGLCRLERPVVKSLQQDFLQKKTDVKTVGD